MSKGSPLSVLDWWAQKSIVQHDRMIRAVIKELEMIKPNASPTKGTGKLALDDPLAWKGFPGWRSFFLDQTYGADESERTAGLLIVRPTGDGWQWTLKDPSSCLMLKFTSRTWDEGVVMGEGLLVDPKAPWETDSYESAKRAKSRGKRS